MSAAGLTGRSPLIKPVTKQESPAKPMERLFLLRNPVAQAGPKLDPNAFRIKQVGRLLALLLDPSSDSSVHPPFASGFNWR
jgi:hypothetical protein